MDILWSAELISELGDKYKVSFLLNNGIVRMHVHLKSPHNGRQNTGILHFTSSEMDSLISSIKRKE